MKYFVDDKEVDLNTLKQVNDNLKHCTNYSREYEELILDSITEDEIHFLLVTQKSIF